MTNLTSDKTRIAFVHVSVLEDENVRGGVLVTDLFTRPYEFRVTSPIKPTQLQKILYGKSLYQYMYGELICLPLIKQLKESISLAICCNENLLVARTGLQVPLVVIKKNGRDTDNEGVEAYTLITHKNFASERAQADGLLKELSQQFDLFEPFERVKMAISEVNKQKIN